MAKKKRGSASKFQRATKAPARQPSSWYTKLALAAGLAVATGGTAYGLRGPIGDLYSALRDGVVSALGLGVVPVALWLGVFAWALATRRSWFSLRHANLWLGSLAAVAASLGALAFFQPYKGAFAGFTLYGDVPLGGHAGKALIGPAGWQGGLRLSAVLAAGVAVTAPALAALIAIGMRGLAARAYLVAAGAGRGIGRMYRLEQGREATAFDLDAQPNMPPEVLSPYTRIRTLLFPGLGPNGTQPSWKADVAQFQETVLSMPRKRGVAVLADPVAHATDEWQRGLEQPASEARPVGDSEAPSSSGSGKFNRFWASSELPSDDAVGGDPEEAETEPEPAPMPVAREWALPPIGLLLDMPEGGITEEEMSETAETIAQTLAQYGVEVEIGQVRPGPTVTMYGLVPGWTRRYKQVKEIDDEGHQVLDELGKPMLTQAESKTRVKVDNILSREKDLALALKTQSIRIETPAMGESLVGIEVPNPNPSLVTLRSVMASPEFVELRGKAQLPVALGMGSGGEAIVTDLARMPHLLIAGATGSGKSVCINTIVSCLMMERTPAELRLLLVDPKRVELTPYNGIPHLLTPVVVEVDQVVGLLKGLIHEMLDRYRRFEGAAVRNIEAYNQKMPDTMPFLVVAIDELADLMMSASYDVEQSLCRLAQLGRATGIHLIVATQRPSVDVVTGLIKANFPSRISFGVASQVDSRTILDTAGAEKLLGRGDMLYLPLDASRPVRAQGVFISDPEIESLVGFWRATPRGPQANIHLRAVKDTRIDDEQEVDASQDELMEKAIGLAQMYSKLSTSLLQRRLRIGYPRAARLMDQLEEQGVVGPSDGSKSRDVIMKKAEPPIQAPTAPLA